MSTDISFGHLDLGDIIAALEADLAANGDRVLPVGFHKPHSWRGDYMDLAFEPVADIAVSAVLAAAKSALGATFQGYKGGDFTMTKESYCWLDTYGDSGGETIGAYSLARMLAAGQAEVPQ